MTNVAGIFNTRMQAETAITELMNAGFERDDIGILVSDKARGTIFPTSADNDNVTSGDRVTRDSAAGALWGGALGVLVAGLTTVGSIVIPGAGLLASGPIVAALAGAGAGAAAGGLAGALIGAGFSADEANRYEREIKMGKAVLIVHTTDDKADLARRILRNMDGQVKAA